MPKKKTMQIPIFLFIQLFSLFFTKEENTFSLIRNKNKYGYINAKGEVVIEPRFESIGKFQDGIAPARINGFYGYINLKGEFVIQPKYDYAYEFRNGRAIVEKNNQQNLIDNKGNQILKKSYYNIDFFSDKHFLAKNLETSLQDEVIDLNGKILIDTNYTILESDAEGTYIKAYKDSQNVFFDEYGKIWADTQNIPIIRDDYDNLILYGNNYKEGLVSDKGNCLLDTIYEKIIYDAQKNIFTVLYDEKTGFEYNSGDFVFFLNKEQCENYLWLIDNLCRPILHFFDMDTYVIYKRSPLKKLAQQENVEYIDLGGNLMLIKKDTCYYFADVRTGQALNGEYFDEVDFDNALENALSPSKKAYTVRKGTKWGVVNNKGAYLIKPEITAPIFIVNEHFMFVESDSMNFYHILYANGQIMSNHKFFYSNDFENGLLRLSKEDGHWTYLDEQGKIIWEETKYEHEIFALNIDFKTLNMAKPILMTDEINDFHYWKPWKTTKIGREHPIEERIVAETSPYADTTYAAIAGSKKCKGRLTKISNLSNKTSVEMLGHAFLYFVVLQAKNQFGEWQDIEWFRGGGCISEVRSVGLPRRSSANIITPEYEGNFKTKLRLKLEGRVHNFMAYHEFDISPLPPPPIVSYTIFYGNEYDGSINLSQFRSRIDEY